MVKILYFGNAYTPQRFHKYLSVSSLTEEQEDILKSNGWLQKYLTISEQRRVKDSGCLGDLLDSFETMHGVVCYNKN